MPSYSGGGPSRRRYVLVKVHGEDVYVSQTDVRARIQKTVELLKELARRGASTSAADCSRWLDAAVVLEQACRHVLADADLARITEEVWRKFDSSLVGEAK